MNFVDLCLSAHTRKSIYDLYSYISVGVYFDIIIAYLDLILLYMYVISSLLE